MEGLVKLVSALTSGVGEAKGIGEAKGSLELLLGG